MFFKGRALKDTMKSTDLTNLTLIMLNASTQALTVMAQNFLFAMLIFIPTQDTINPAVHVSYEGSRKEDF